MLASSRPHDGYIMEYQSSSPVAGNVGIGLSQSIAGVYWQMSFLMAGAGLGRAWLGKTPATFIILCLVRERVKSETKVIKS